MRRVLRLLLASWVLLSAQDGEDAVVAGELEAVATAGRAETTEHELAAWADQGPPILGGSEDQTTVRGAVKRSSLGSDRESRGPRGKAAHLS